MTISGTDLVIKLVKKLNMAIRINTIGKNRKKKLIVTD